MFDINKRRVSDACAYGKIPTRSSTARASPTPSGEKGIFVWLLRLLPPHWISRDQVGSTRPRARHYGNTAESQRERRVKLTRHAPLDTYYMEVWELRLYFYPSAGGLKRRRRLPKATTFAVYKHRILYRIPGKTPKNIAHLTPVGRIPNFLSIVMYTWYVY